MSKMRTFASGATRDDDTGKLDYEGFLSPIVLERYAEYMNENRKQSDGKLRDSDNWQKGIPIAQYMKSMFRHFIHVWSIHRGYDKGCIETALCALLFNVMGMLHEILKAKIVRESLPIVSENDTEWLETVENGSRVLTYVKQAKLVETVYPRVVADLTTTVDDKSTVDDNVNPSTQGGVVSACCHDSVYYSFDGSLNNGATCMKCHKSTVPIMLLSDHNRSTDENLDRLKPPYSTGDGR